jgi:hypothetical protein
VLSTYDDHPAKGVLHIKSRSHHVGAPALHSGDAELVQLISPFLRLLQGTLLGGITVRAVLGLLLRNCQEIGFSFEIALFRLPLR